MAYFRGFALFDEKRQKQYDALVRDYYRYQEIAMNFILPTVFLTVAVALSLALSLVENPQPVTAVVLVLVLALGIAGAIQLLRAGYDYYWHYKVKTAYFVRSLWEQLNESPQDAAPGR